MNGEFMKKLYLATLVLFLNIPGTVFAGNPAFNELLTRFAPGTQLRAFMDIKTVSAARLENLWKVSGSNGCKIELDSRNNKVYPSGRTFLITITSGDGETYSVFRAEERDSSMIKTTLADGTAKYQNSGSTLFIKGKQVAIISDWSYGARNKILVCGGMSQMN